MKNFFGKQVSNMTIGDTLIFTLGITVVSFAPLALMIAVPAVIEKINSRKEEEESEEEI